MTRPTLDLVDHRTALECVLGRRASIRRLHRLSAHDCSESHRAGRFSTDHAGYGDALDGVDGVDARHRHLAQSQIKIETHHSGNGIVAMTVHSCADIRFPCFLNARSGLRIPLALLLSSALPCMALSPVPQSDVTDNDATRLLAQAYDEPVNLKSGWTGQIAVETHRARNG